MLLADLDDLGRAIRWAENAVKIGGIESESDDPERRAHGLARMDRGESALAGLLPLRDAIEGNRDATNGLAVLADLASGRAEREARQVRALDCVIDDHPDAEAGVRAVMRYMRGGR